MNKLEREHKINILKEIEKGNSEAIKELLPRAVVFEHDDYFEFDGKKFPIDQLPEFKKTHNLVLIITLVDSSKPMPKKE